jgi:hypothetical protein
MLEVRLGADTDRCHIVIPESLGVLPEHVRLIRQGPENLIVTPSERTALVYLWKPGARRPTPVATPTAVRPGDAISLVTPDGPRFIIELDILPPELVAAREESQKRRGTGRSRLSAESMKQEVKRQAFTRLLVLGPAQLAQRAITFVKSGAIYQPRNIILGITLIGGYLFGGAMLCSNRNTAKAMATTQQKYDDCAKEQAYDKGAGGETDDLSFDQLAANITGQELIGLGLKRDDKLRNDVKQQIKVFMADSARFDWIVKKKDQQVRDFVAWREQLEKAEALDDPTRALAMWLAAGPDRSRDPFDKGIDSEDREVCVRGPLRMTWRQAWHLNLNPRFDAFFKGASESVASDAERAPLLQQTADTAGVKLPESFETDIQALASGTRAFCVHEVGDDLRMKPAELRRAMEKQLAADAPGLPVSGNAFAAISRIAYFWAADVTTTEWDPDAKRLTGVAFSENTPPSESLAALGGRGAWVQRQTAQTIAASLAVPCLLKLEGEKEQIKRVMGEDDRVPSAMPCLFLNWQMTRGSE